MVGEELDGDDVHYRLGVADIGYADPVVKEIVIRAKLVELEDGPDVMARIGKIKELHSSSVTSIRVPTGKDTAGRVRELALRWKIRTIPAMQYAVFSTDPRFESWRERCEVYLSFVGRSPLMSEERYESVGEGACQAYPLDAYPWEE